jgi:hypothetical protein
MPWELKKRRELLDINLRSSCIGCQFILNCPIAKKTRMPKSDVLLAAYGLKALVRRCLV